jgi:hypothetical protein
MLRTLFVSERVDKEGLGSAERQKALQNIIDSLKLKIDCTGTRSLNVITDTFVIQLL